MWYLFFPAILRILKGALDKSDFATLWSVIRALKAHDEIFAEELDELRNRLGKRISRTSGQFYLPDKLVLDFPTDISDDLVKEIQARTIEKVTAAPNLTEEQIILWAKEWFKKNGKWPTLDSGEIEGSNGENWSAVNQAIRHGLRGLPRKITLADLLQEQGLKKNKQNQECLTEEQIILWAKEYYKVHNHWPKSDDNHIINGSNDETWTGINSALNVAGRGLPRKISLASLLQEAGLKRNFKKSPITLDKILEWADAHKKATGKWPNQTSGNIIGVLDENWANVEQALQSGLRGLDKSSLAKLLEKHRGKRNIAAIGRLSEKTILEWADQYLAINGKYPTKNSGEIPNSNGETWGGVNAALRKGIRGIQRKITLSALLHETKRKRNRFQAENLSEKQILQWIDDYYKAHGNYPKHNFGTIKGTLETWSSVDNALQKGTRGLPGGSSITKLLSKHRDIRSSAYLADLTEEQIILWAKEWFEKNGKWPTSISGQIEGSGGETWGAIQAALPVGGRGLPRKITLADLLQEQGLKKNKQNQECLSEEKILNWADQYHEKNEKWPNRNSGQIEDSEGETWMGIQSSLAVGGRGLPRKTSLAKLLHEKRSV